LFVSKAVGKTSGSSIFGEPEKLNQGIKILILDKNKQKK
jgi:hypothetical protein